VSVVPGQKALQVMPSAAVSEATPYNRPQTFLQQQSTSLLRHSVKRLNSFVLNTSFGLFHIIFLPQHAGDDTFKLTKRMLQKVGAKNHELALVKPTMPCLAAEYTAS
jgi:hypothetical protein